MERKASTPPKLVIRRTIKAKRDRVFAAWSKPEVMSQWFHAGGGKSEVTNDFRVGGSYKNIMTLTPSSSGQQSCGAAEGARTAVHHGEYLEIVPPEKLVFTWSSHVVTDTRVTIEFRDLGDSTELTLTHELLATEELRKGHNGGWDACLTNLSHYLE